MVIVRLDGKKRLAALYSVDLWGAADDRAFCDRYSLKPSSLGQEMGHGDGLKHLRRDGSTADYGVDIC